MSCSREEGTGPVGQHAEAHPNGELQRGDLTVEAGLEVAGTKRMSGGVVRRAHAGSGQTPREEKLRRGSAGDRGPLRSNGTDPLSEEGPADGQRLPRGVKAPVGSVPRSPSGAWGRNVKRAIPWRRVAGPGSGGKPLKGEPQGRYQHETRLEGPGEEETVERVRNPEGGTNPVRQAGEWWTRPGSSVEGGRTP